MRRNWILLILIMIGTGFLASRIGGSVTQLLFYSSFLVPLLSLIYLWIVYVKFCIYQQIGTKVLVKEELVPYLFKLANEDILSYTKIQVDFMSDYSTVENMNQSITYCLLPQDVIHRETALRCHYRGIYKVGIDHVIVTDYLRLFTLTYHCKSKIEVQVLPRVVNISKLVIAPDSEDVKTRKYLIQARNEIPDIEVRKYQSGDSLRMIHWKASARTGELLTRKYTEDPKTEMILLLDLQKKHAKEGECLVIEDKIIEAVIAITDYFVRNHTPVTVIFANPNIQKFVVYKTEDFNQFYEFCSHVRFRAEHGCEKLLQASIQHSLGHQYCMLLTAQFSDQFSKQTYEYVNMGNELSIVMVSDDNLKEKVEQLESRIRFYQIHLQQEVREVLEKEAL